MKKSVFLTLFLSLSCLVNFSAINAYYFKAEQCLAPDKKSVLLFSDLHTATKESNKKKVNKQQEDIVNFALKNKSAIIVEDGILAEEEQAHSLDCQSFYLDLPTLNQCLKTDFFDTPLQGLASWCNAKKIPHTNVEFRFHELSSTKRTLAFIERMKENLKNYDDGELFTPYFSEKLADLEKIVEQPCKELFDLLKKSNKPIEEFCYSEKLPHIKNIDSILAYLNYEEDITNYDDETYQEKVISLYMDYCCVFIDLGILHAIHKHQDCNNIIICAGGWHIDNIKNVLRNFGYTTELVAGSDLDYDTYQPETEPDAVDIEPVLLHTGINLVQNDTTFVATLTQLVINLNNLVEKALSAINSLFQA